MGQPSDKPTSKRVDELKVGDYIHDGRGIGPVEVAYTLAHPNQHGEERILLVTGDAAVSYHRPPDLFTMATAAEMVQGEHRRQRAGIVKKIREYADWVEQHPELPAPTSMELRMQHSLITPGSTDAEKLATAARVAEALGETVQAEAHRKGGSVRVRHTVAAGPYGAYVLTYVVHGFLSAPPPLDPEKPLDELPANFGADHDPDNCDCEDCDPEVDIAIAAGAAYDPAREGGNS